MEASTKIANIMILGKVIDLLGCDHIGDIVI